jgi:hypothetical protein
VEQLVARWAHNPKVVCSSQASATKHYFIKHRGVEQLVARWAHNPKVVCSSQASATNFKEKPIAPLFFILSVPIIYPI